MAASDVLLLVFLFMVLQPLAGQKRLRWDIFLNDFQPALDTPTNNAAKAKSGNCP